jgi:hypothetical protein
MRFSQHFLYNQAAFQMSQPFLSLFGGKDACDHLQEERRLKLNNFPKFERPAKIDLSELFWGRLKGYVDFFCYCMITRQLIVNKMPINNARKSQKKFRRSIFAGLSNLGKLFSFTILQFASTLKTMCRPHACVQNLSFPSCLA